MKLNKTKIPDKSSVKLAEFFGIMLGDGCCSSNQITISGGTIDGSYISEYIPNLVMKLFNRKVNFRKIALESLDCLLHSVDVSSMLRSMGFSSPKIDCKIPNYYFNNEQLLKACIRGLFDTDGGLHRHHKASAQLKFTNKSTSIVDSLFTALTQFGYRPARTIDHKEKKTHALYLFSKDVKKYFDEIGSSNPKNQLKFRKWIENGIVPLNIEIEEEVRLSKSVQEELLGKKLDSIKIVGFGANK
jgi:DNA-binding transcriptional regulator WhiA